MYIISLNYIAPLDEVDSLLEEHVEFLKKQYQEEKFIASGRKVPRTGGIILARANNKEEINTIIKQDPFYIKGIAEYEVTEFVASMTLPEFGNLNDS
jgi:uncharacterized protein YciI